MFSKSTLFEILNKRRSIRRFIKKDVTIELVLDAIKNAALAPSPKNRQPWKFIVAKDEYKDSFVEFSLRCLEDLKLENKRYGSLDISLKAMQESDVLIIVSNPYDKDEDYKSRWEKSDLQAIGAAIQNLLLAVTAYGLGSLWINDIYFIKEHLQKWLNMENEIYAVIAIGYPGENKSYIPPGKGINEIVEIRAFN